jgi:hypothetical protein
MTSYDVAKKMQPMYEKEFETSMKAKAVIVDKLMKALAKLDRGGMKLELDGSGKVKSISYTEHFDLDVIKKALDMPKMEHVQVKSGLQETADVMRSLAGWVIPLGSMYYGYKVVKSNNGVERDRINANVEITKSNNDLSKSMYKDFTTVQYPPEYMVSNGTEEEEEVTEETTEE